VAQRGLSGLAIMSRVLDRVGRLLHPNQGRDAGPLMAATNRSASVMGQLTLFIRPGGMVGVVARGLDRTESAVFIEECGVGEPAMLC
jgi:hypothetical protein